MTTRKNKQPKAVEASIVDREDTTHEPDADSTIVFPIVGIGASAGGLAAFEAFFSGMPADKDPGMAFVLVQHLAPDHKSILTELIRRYTRMQVFEVEDGVKVQPNCAYIIPPNHDMAFLNGTLQLLEPSAPRGQRLPIDFFFRSLAQDLRERAIGVVLSGTGSDGALGVRAIKGEGGMVMVQTPASTAYNGMPCSALATGLVDYELPPNEMAAKIMAYVAHAFGLSSGIISIPSPKAENALKRLFVLMRNQTGHDFSMYKPNTVQRRIERRMAVHQIKTMDDYVKYSQQNPAEVEALFRDMLIGVTSFFRDPEAFKVLEEQAIPKLFAGKPAGAAIRVWAPGCSTGEEAYSLAILLAEFQESIKMSYKVQVFATDIDSQAIATARAGLYAASIAADISAERLERYFTLQPDGGAYRIHKGLRDMLIFSEQNIIKNPPFSKLDLISCRNLLIYLGGDLQKKVIPLFHYALNPGGMLFLGTSETVGDFGDLFAVLDRKSKLYRRKEDFQGIQRAALGRFLPPMTSMDVAHPRDAGKPVSPAKLPLRELTEQALLRQAAPAAALVNGQGDILYLHGRTGMYLEPSQGEAGINNILKMASEGLQQELFRALRKASVIKEIVRCPGLRVKTNGDFTMVNLVIRPVAPVSAMASDEPLFLVVLEEAYPPPTALDAGASPPPASPQSAGNMNATGGNMNDMRWGMNNAGGILNAGEADRIFAETENIPFPPACGRASGGIGGETEIEAIAALKQELRAKEEYLQAANEELETTNEELKSSNEEMQSVNEELQSTNEELETSKEELQSVNEELATVNAELQTKVADLSRANNDMNNLLAGTGIATIFVDHQLRILRFTPGATGIINLILSDVGRPVGHIVTNLAGYDRLVPDVQAVLDTLIPRDVEVQTTEGRYFSMHIQPYRTLDNVIEGAVITFADITEIKRAEETLRKANDLLRLAVVVRDAHDAITVQDLDGRILAWNPGAVGMYGWTETEALAMNVRDRIPGNQKATALTNIHQLAKSRVLEPYSTQRIAKDGAVVEVWMTATALVDETGRMYAIATTERPITESNNSQE